jgi:lipopolysaccharide transport system ATP-binding protein
MSDTVISVENLGKKYFLSHQRQESYLALRDVLTEGVKNAARKIAAPFSSRRGGDGDPDREEFWALKGVSFEIQQGDRIGIIGRNGAGKSTLLKILSRITEPTEGRVRIRGRVASLLEVGTGFHPELTGRENVFLNGAILGMTNAEIKRKFDKIVSFAEVEKFLDTPVKHYSSGMYVRLAFAVAAHLEPEILVVDEVLAVGDAQFQKKCLGKMEDVSSRERRTVLFVSHNMPAVQRLCNRCILLEQGRISRIGATPQIVGDYLAAGGNTAFYWEHQGSSKGKGAYLSKVSLVDYKNEQVNYVDTGGQLRINFEYILRQPYVDLQVSMGLLDDYGVVIFGSSPVDSGLAVPKEAGKYRALVEFPSGVLMPMTYMIRTVLWTLGGGIIDSSDNIRFSVQETASLSNSTPGGRAGLIALPCRWELESIPGHRS